MGTWSRPLFARVSHGTPAEYHVSRPATGWGGTAFFQTKGTGPYTLAEFMDTGCDSHRILDHLDAKKIADWKALCQTLMTNYPVLEWVEFHFYSSDAQFPYCLRYARATGDLLLCETGEQDPRFMKRQGRTWGEWLAGRAEEDIEESWIFEEDKYALQLDSLLFKHGVLQAREDVFPAGGMCRWIGEPATLGTF